MMRYSLCSVKAAVSVNKIVVFVFLRCWFHRLLHKVFPSFFLIQDGPELNLRQETRMRFMFGNRASTDGESELIGQHLANETSVHLGFSYSMDVFLSF